MSFLFKSFPEFSVSSENQIYISIVSFWELGLKKSLGKITLETSIDALYSSIQLDYDFKIYPLKIEHIFKMINLPFHHKDPFDRMIISQSIAENIPLLYTDSVFENYFN